MDFPFDAGGVPEELKHLLAGGKVLGPPQQQVVDPRQLPFTYEEVRFRNCTHMWMLIPDPEVDEGYCMIDFLIRDVARGKVYKYGLPLEGAENLILELQELIKARDEKNVQAEAEAKPQDA